MMTPKKIHWTEYFRIITPFLLLVITGYASIINGRLCDIDNKLFEHLTNAELHFPRTQVVTKLEYDAIQRMRDKQWQLLELQLQDIKSLIRVGNTRDSFIDLERIK